MHIELLYSAVQWFYSAWQRLSWHVLATFLLFTFFKTSSLFLFTSPVLPPHQTNPTSSSPPLSSSELLLFASSPDKMHVLLFFSLFRCFPPFFSSQESVNMRNSKFYSGVIFLNLKFVRRHNDNKIRVHLDLIGCFCGLFFYPTLAIFSERENSNSSNIKHKT